MSKKSTIGITLGDVAGIGPEIVRKALASRELDDSFRYKIVLQDRIPSVRPGKPSALAAHFAVASLEAAVEGILSGACHGIVTGPVNKAGLSRIGHRHPGQTEWFAARTRTRRFAMMMHSDKLRVALVSTHLSLSAAIRAIRPARIVEVAALAREFLLKLGVRHPRIAVAGLNPHAGEDGLFGKEEKKIIEPAVGKLKKKGWHVEGPLPPDTVFLQAAEGRFDAVVCMYHDQGLIPFKLLAFDRGVNATLGLPFARTSPDHGTAYDIAGKNRADPHSMIEAIKLACVLTKKGKTN